MAGATRITFIFISMLASVSQARITEVSRLSDMPLTTLASVFALSAIGQSASFFLANETTRGSKPTGNHKHVDDRLGMHAGD